MWPQGWNKTAAFLSEQTTHSSICGETNGTTKRSQSVRSSSAHACVSGWDRQYRVWYLGSWLDLILADETLLDTRWAQGAGGDVSAGPEQSVSLHVRAHHTLLQRLDVAVQRRAAGAHLTTGTLRIKTTVSVCVCVCVCVWERAQRSLEEKREADREQRK